MGPFRAQGDGLPTVEHVLAEWSDIEPPRLKWRAVGAARPV